MTEQGKQAGILYKSRLKKEAAEMEEGRRGWSELAVCWQSVKHLHQEEKRKEKGLVTAPDTPTCPPPYAPSALITHGLYPTMFINNGTLQIGDEEEEISSACSMSQSPTCVTKLKDKCNIKPDHAEYNSSAQIENVEVIPFESRQRREKEVSQIRQAEEEAIQREMKIMRRQLAQEEERERQRKVNMTAKGEVNQEPRRGHLKDKRKTGQATFTGTGQWEGEEDEVAVQMNLQGEWREEECEDDRQSQTSDGQRLTVFRDELLNNS